MISKQGISINIYQKPSTTNTLEAPPISNNTPILFDNHLHLRRDGLFLQAIKDFEHAGGTHCILCQYPMPQLVLKHHSYLPAYQHTLDMAQEINTTTNVTAYITVGPYPVDYLKFIEIKNRDYALSIMKQGMDEAAQFCQDGYAIGIGEIGRPHFPIEADILADSNTILQYGMQKAHDINVPIIIHSERTTPEQCLELKTMAQTCKLPPEKIIKHFAPPLITPEENHGLIPSVLASKKNILTALTKGNRFLMETDYIDDPRRPGAVLGPKTVPRLTTKLLESGHMTDQQYTNVHITLPEKTYNISLSQ